MGHMERVLARDAGRTGVGWWEGGGVTYSNPLLGTAALLNNLGRLKDLVSGPPSLS